MKKIAVVGAGASGMTAAIEAAREAARQETFCQIFLLEHKDLPGKKILSTGNGRCNLTNQFLDVSCFHSQNPEIVSDVLRQFGFQETQDFFASLGLLTKSRNGYIYPQSDQASAVRSLLESELKRWKIPVHTGAHVDKIRREKEGFRLNCSGKHFYADRVILSAGGKASSVLGSDGSGYQLAASLGHSCLPVVPALVQLKIKSNPFAKASGVRVEGSVTAVCSGKEAAKDRGELQITDYGISGIPVFQVSRHLSMALQKRERAELFVDLAPWMESQEALYQFLEARRTGNESTSAGDFLIGLFHQKLIPRILDLAKIRMTAAVGDLSRENLQRLARCCKSVRLTVSDTTGFEHAQVCAGGIPLCEINSHTMESNYTKGLYLTGELLDADGICGGYNLQWAWATGFLAGRAALRSLLRRR